MTTTRVAVGFAEVSYRAADGRIVTTVWEALDSEAVSLGRPWRTFPWYLVQKNYSGFPPRLIGVAGCCCR